MWYPGSGVVLDLSIAGLFRLSKFLLIFIKLPVVINLFCHSLSGRLRQFKKKTKIGYHDRLSLNAGQK